jgi:Ca-activated chloride channel family protein
MSFASPLWLLGLLAVPLALAAHVAGGRRARKYAVRFTAIPSLRLAAGTTPAWRKHLPAGLALLALAALVLALAKPQHSVAVPVRSASIMLVTDHSRSMEATDVSPTRLAAAERAAHTFLKQLPNSVRVGIVTFSSSADAVQTPTTNHSLVSEVIDRQVADGATATGDALQVALGQLAREQSRSGTKPASAIVLLSDGATTTGTDPVQVAQTAKAQHVPIYTVALGTPDGVLPGNGFQPDIPVPPDPQTLRLISETSGGRAFTAQDADQLSSIYRSLGASFGTRKAKREITASFAIGGLVLLLGAAATSRRWLGRLP